MQSNYPDSSFCLQLRHFLSERTSIPKELEFSKKFRRNGISLFEQAKANISKVNQPNLFNIYDYIYYLTFDREWITVFNSLSQEDQNTLLISLDKLSEPFREAMSCPPNPRPHPVVKEANGQGMNYIEELKFESWEGTICNKPKYTFIPKTITGLQNLIKWANTTNKKIRVSGYRHSSNDLFSEDEQILVSMIDLKTATVLPARHPTLDPNNELQGIQLVGEPYLDKNGQKKIKCKIGAGTCNYHFQDWAVNPKGGGGKWTLPSNVIMTEITFGGSNAAICHGAGIEQMTLSDLVTEIEFINVKGERQVINDKELLKSAAGCFGLLGIVTSITFELSEMTYANFETVQKKLLALSIPPAQEDVSHLKSIPYLSYENKQAFENEEAMQSSVQAFIDHAQNHYYSEWFWFPLHDKCWINVWNNNGNKTEVQRYPGAFTTYRQRIEAYLVHLTNQFLTNVKTSPHLKKIQTKLFSDLAMFLLPDKERIECYLIDALHFRQGIQNIKAMMMEIEIPIPDRANGEPDWSVCQKAWWAVVETVYNEKNLKTFPMRTTLEMRIMGGSNITMAPQYKNKRTCSIEVLTPAAVSNENWEEFLQEVLDKWAALKDESGKFLNIRPHWAKRLTGLKLRRDTSWLQELSHEDIKVMNLEISLNGKLTVPLTEYLKHIAYKAPIDKFLADIQTICNQGGYTMRELHERFSNPFLDDLLSLTSRIMPKDIADIALQNMNQNSTLPAEQKSNLKNHFLELNSFKNLKSYVEHLKYQACDSMQDHKTMTKAMELNKFLDMLTTKNIDEAIHLIKVYMNYFNQPRGYASRFFKVQTSTCKYLKDLLSDLQKITDDYDKQFICLNSNDKLRSLHQKNHR